jgi:hypothetical protein
MITVFAKHAVEDYDSWKATYDEDAGVREEYGYVGNERLFREAGKPNEVVILNEWESMEGNQRFMEESGLDERMEESGVIGEPELYFLEELETKERAQA